MQLRPEGDLFRLDLRLLAEIYSERICRCSFVQHLHRHSQGRSDQSLSVNKSNIVTQNRSQKKSTPLSSLIVKRLSLPPPPTHTPLPTCLSLPLCLPAPTTHALARQLQKIDQVHVDGYADQDTQRRRMRRGWW